MTKRCLSSVLFLPSHPPSLHSLAQPLDPPTPAKSSSCLGMADQHSPRVPDNSEIAGSGAHPTQMDTSVSGGHRVFSESDEVVGQLCDFGVDDPTSSEREEDVGLRHDYGVDDPTSSSSPEDDGPASAGTSLYDFGLDRSVSSEDEE